MKTLIKKLTLGAATVALMTSLAQAAPANIMFVMDASGSMKRDAGNGFSRMDNAKFAIANMLTDVDQANRFGLTVYGHRKARTCSDIQVVASVGAVDAGFVNEFVQQLEPKGETPIAESVRLAAASFEQYPDQNNQLVVVTDGIEECGGDVCRLADEIAGYNIGLKVNVVGFTLNDQQKNLIRCLSDKTGGKFYDANNGEALKTAFAQVKQDIAKAPAAPKKVALKTGPKIWFEDNFDGDRLGEIWRVDNENADNYVVEDGKLLVVFPETGKATHGGATAENIFKLNRAMPKGDWTMTARFKFTAQTHAEWLRFGLTDGIDKSLLGSYEMFTYNYAWTQVKLRVDKLAKGKVASFFNQVQGFNDMRDYAERTRVFGETIEGLQLRLEKRGRNYIVSGKIEGKTSKGWIEIQKMSSIRAPGKELTMMFGNAANGYGPRGGEGFVEVDWVRVTTP
ncbi:MAG: VWA domain-containing protein [Pseudomonadota bacterium]